MYKVRKYSRPIFGIPQVGPIIYKNRSSMAEQKVIEYTNTLYSLKIKINNSVTIDYDVFEKCEKYHREYSLKDPVFINIPPQHIYKVFNNLVSSEKYSIVEEEGKSNIGIKFNYSYCSEDMPIYLTLSLKSINDVDLLLMKITSLTEKVKRLEMQVTKPIEIQIEGVYNLACWIKDYKPEILSLEVVEYMITDTTVTKDIFTGLSSRNHHLNQDATIIFKIKANLMSAKPDRLKFIYIRDQKKMYSCSWLSKDMQILHDKLYHTNLLYLYLDKADTMNYAKNNISFQDDEMYKFSVLND